MKNGLTPREVAGVVKDHPDWSHRQVGWLLARRRRRKMPYTVFYIARLTKEAQMLGFIASPDSTSGSRP